jgi:hypothetical protein
MYIISVEIWTSDGENFGVLKVGVRKKPSTITFRGFTYRRTDVDSQNLRPVNNSRKTDKAVIYISWRGKNVHTYYWPHFTAWNQIDFPYFFPKATCMYPGVFDLTTHITADRDNTLDRASIVCMYSVRWEIKEWDVKECLCLQFCCGWFEYCTYPLFLKKSCSI